VNVKSPGWGNNWKAKDLPDGRGILETRGFGAPRWGVRVGYRDVVNMFHVGSGGAEILDTSDKAWREKVRGGVKDGSKGGLLWNRNLAMVEDFVGGI